MKYLIEEKKFLEEMYELVGDEQVEENGIHSSLVRLILSKHLQDIKDEPHHPSGMNRDKIKIRNELRAEMREGKE